MEFQLTETWDDLGFNAFQSFKLLNVYAETFLTISLNADGDTIDISLNILRFNFILLFDNKLINLE